MSSTLYYFINSKPAYEKKEVSYIRYLILGYPYECKTSRKQMKNYIKNNTYTEEIKLINTEILDRELIIKNYNNYINFICNIYSDLKINNVEYRRYMITLLYCHFDTDNTTLFELPICPKTLKDFDDILTFDDIKQMKVTNQKYHKLTKSNTKKIYNLLLKYLPPELAKLIIEFYKFY